ncbi:MAG: Asp23/Gls24 family envelope stress response protein [Oscillospiraceae bacterium]|nr:Asp23/Gls24 family envelope stress response protein [Oscillospiraceae bacterium]
MTEYLSRIEENGTINIAEDVVAAIVADTVKEVEGVGAMSQNVTEQLSGKKAVRGVRVEKVEDAIVIDLYLMARYGYAIPEVAEKVQESVANAVGGMTGFTVKEVNVHVGGISFND